MFVVENNTLKNGILLSKTSIALIHGTGLVAVFPGMIVFQGSVGKHAMFFLLIIVVVHLSIF